jgi:hypothetical protein
VHRLTIQKSAKHFFQNLVHSRENPNITSADQTTQQPAYRAPMFSGGTMVNVAEREDIRENYSWQVFFFFAYLGFC